MWLMSVIIAAFILSITYAYSPSELHRDYSVEYGNLINKSKYLYDYLSPNFSEQEIKCFELSMLNYKGNCYKSLSRGPCKDGEHLVYDEKGSGAVCRKMLCPQDYQLIREYKKCFHKSDVGKVYCKNKKYVVDIFGENHCTCSEYEGLLLDSEDENCYSFYTRGPCEFGKVIVPVNNGIDVGYGTCEEDLCSDYVSNDTYGVIRVNFESGHSMCYRLKSKGPCPGYMFLLWKSDSLPSLSIVLCDSVGIVPYNIAFASVVSEFCVPNNDGECVKLSNPILEPLEL